MTKIKPINGWTKKTIFEQIKKHNNGKQSNKKYDATCAYRGKNNNKCFVGCFIPDNLYDKKMEDLTASALLRDFPYLRSHMPFGGSLKSSHIMVKFQDVHDTLNTDDDCYEAAKKWLNANVVGPELK